MSTATTTAKVRLALEGADAVQRGLGQVEAKVGDVGKAFRQHLTGLLGGLSVAATVNKLVTVQREFDVLNSSLITVTGSSAAADREFAWIKQFAATTPYQLNEVTGAFVKMKALGLDASRESLASYGNTASAMGKGLNQMIEAVADAATGEFERLKEFGIKSKSEGDRVTFTFRGVSTQVGKNAAEITQYLRGIGETDFAGAMELRARTLDGAISNLADTWDELFRTINNNSAGSLIYDTVTLASGALRDAVTIMEALTGATQKNGQATGAMAAIQGGLATIFETVAVLGVNLRFVLVGIGREIGGLAAQAAAVMTGNFAQAAEIRRLMIADAQAARQEVDAQTKAILNARREAARIEGAAGLDEPRFRRLLNPQSAAAAAATDRNTASTKALAAATWEAAKADREKAAAERELEQAAKALADVRVRVMQLTDQAANEYLRSADVVMEANEALRQEIALIGLDETARAALLRTKEAEILADKELLLLSLQSAGADAVTLASLEREIALRQQRLGLLDDKTAAEAAQATKEAQDKLRADELAAWQRTNDQIAQSFTDALMAGGKSVADYLKDLFRTLVLRPVLEPVGRSMANSVMSLFGGGGGSANVFTQMLSGSGFDPSAIFSGFGDSLALAADSAGSWLVNNTTGMLNQLGGSLMGNAGMVGTAGSLAAGAAIGHFGGRAISNGYSTGGSGNTAVNVGTAIGMAIAGPIGAALGGIAGGVFNRAFGRKLTETGFSADLTGGRVSGVYDYQHQSGGWFRSDKTTRTATNDPAAMAFAAQAQAVAQASNSMAAALGLGEQALDAYTGEVKVNLRGAEDAAEVQRRMTQAMDDLQFKMLQGAEGFDMARDQFGQFMDGVRASMQQAGISADVISNGLLDMMAGKLSSEQAGAQLADAMVGGIYRMMAQTYTQQIGQMFMTQIMTPVVTAMAAGVPITQAVSQAAMDNMLQNARAVASALGAILNDPALRAFMEEIGSTMMGVVDSFSGISFGSYAADLDAYNAAADEANAIMQERFALEGEILTLLGKTTQLRERELAAMDASLHPLQRQVWLLEDTRQAAEDATEAVRRAIEAQKDLYQTQLDAAREAEGLWNDVFGTLRDAARAQRSAVEPARLLDAQQGQRDLAAMLSGQMAVTADAVREAVRAVEEGIDQTVYTSALDRDRARLSAALQFEALQRVAGTQLSAAEAAVVALESQISQLDVQIQVAEDALNVALGIDNSVKSVGAAVAAQTAALAAYTAAVSSTMTDAFLTVAQAVSSGGGGGGGGGWSGGGYEAPRSFDPRSYLAKNPDVAAEFDRNAGRSGWPRELNTPEAYAQWHWEQYGQREGRAFAQGAAFTNGIVSRPTLFDVGLMGEGGRKEGILPLANVGGDLGVRAITGSDAETKALLRAMLARLDALERHTASTATATANTDQRLKGVIREEDGNRRLMVGTPGLVPLPVQVAA